MADAMPVSYTHLVRTLRQKLGDGGALIKTIRNVGYMAEAK